MLGHYKRNVGFVTEIPLMDVCKWLIREGIASDKFRAKAVIIKEVGKLALQSEGLMLYDEFSRLFAKGIFKKALNDACSKFGAVINRRNHTDGDGLPMAQKLNQLNR